MSDDKKIYYNENYYKSHCGECYQRGHGWEEIFAGQAELIKRDLNPQTTLDVGCAAGYLVEGLRDLGVEAYGMDISEYALSTVRDDIKPYCWVQSATSAIEKKYDLITCIEVLEHLESDDIRKAIKNICTATDDIIFSSTPFDFEEKSHISIHAPEYWAEQFAYNGFYHDIQYDCSYISVQAMRFRRAEKNKTDLIRDYERELFQKHQEIVALRHQHQLCEDNVEIYKEAYQKHVDLINQELNPKINELNEKLIEIEEEFSERRKVIQNEVEEHCSLRFDEEVQKRKWFEEKYYECLSHVTELEHVKSAYTMLQKEYDKSYMEHYNMSFWNMIKKWLIRKKTGRRLLSKKIEYWAPVFDAEYYSKNNKDIFEVFGTNEKALLKHFINYGMYEGRKANDEFDINVYINCNSDVAEQWKLDKRQIYLHYIEHGKRENRRSK